MFSRLWWVACLLLGLAVQSGDRVAVAGEFDGTWVGKIGCLRGAGPFEARVDNYRFTAALGRGPAPVAGIIRADHRLNLYWEGGNYLYGKFDGERFDGGGDFGRGKCRFRLARKNPPETVFVGPHDGAWHLEVVTGCRAEDAIKGVIHVRGGDLNGIAIGLLTYEFEGTVSADGGFEGLSSAYAISGRFAPGESRAEIQYRKLAGACAGTSVLSRTWPTSPELLVALPNLPEIAEVAAIGQTGDNERPPNLEAPDTPTAEPKVDAPAAPSAIALALPAVPVPKPKPTPEPSSLEGPQITEFEAELVRLRHLHYRDEIDYAEYSRLRRETFEQFDMPLPEVMASLEQPPVIVDSEPITIEFGRFFALVIGNNDYLILNDLKTAVHDATVVADILENDYGFTVALLIDATRAEIIDELDWLGRTIEDEDNFLIYYGGHGLLNEATDRGYWLPVDAEPFRRRNWISNADITDTLRAVRARHAIVVADSSYSGTLARGVTSEFGFRSAEGYFSKISKMRSRNVLASGGSEPVADGGGSGHSVFARAFIEELRANRKIIEGNALAHKIKQRVRINAEQTPIYRDIRRAGHELGGDFIFVRKEFARSIISKVE